MVSAGPLAQPLRCDREDRSSRASSEVHRLGLYGLALAPNRCQRAALRLLRPRRKADAMTSIQWSYANVGSLLLLALILAGVC